MKKIFKITFLEDDNTLYVAANCWERIGQVYENAFKIELISDKIIIVKDKEEENKTTLP